MPEVKVEKARVEKIATPAKTEGAVVRPDDFLATAFPFGNFFGRHVFNMNPFALMREMDRNFWKARAPETWTPVIDIRRCNGDLVITAELRWSESRKK